MSGTPSNIHVLRSLRGALGRRIAVGGSSRKELDRSSSDELAALLDEGVPLDDPRVVELKHLIHHLHTRAAGDSLHRPVRPALQQPHQGAQADAPRR